MTGVVATAETMTSLHRDPHRLGHGRADARPTPGHGTGGPASKRIIVGFGFWIFLLSDIVMFAAFFAAYAVLAANTAGGPKAAELFDLRNAAAETACLLVSSFTCGLASYRSPRAQHDLVLRRHERDFRARGGLPRP